MMNERNPTPPPPNPKKLLEQFQTLLERSASLLHRIDGVDWNDIVVAKVNDEVPPSTLSLKDDADNRDDDDVGEDDDDGDSSDEDDMMMMLGGGMMCSDSDDDDDDGGDDPIMDDDAQDDDDEEEEEDASLLRRAASVHAALLLSASTSIPSSDDDWSAEALANAAITHGSTSSNPDGAHGRLVSVLSFVVSSSSAESMPRSFRVRLGKERWRRACLTNSLLAVQFLLHLKSSSSSSSTNSNESCGGGGSCLGGWNAVILPLLLGGASGEGPSSSSSSSAPSMFLANGHLRDAVLDLVVPPSSSSSPSDSERRGSEAAAGLCLGALRRATASSTREPSLRRKDILVVCEVLIRMFDMFDKKLRRVRSSSSSSGMSEGLEIVRGAMHEAALIILRGICYETTITTAEYRQPHPPLSLEALRPVTGALLPKLYPRDDAGNCTVADERAIGLWNELSSLLRPPSDFSVGETYHRDGRRCCKNWAHVAPMAATAMLCILLPAFRKMELPAHAASPDEVGVARCRPIFQPGVWRLLRGCLGRCGDSDSPDGGGRGTSLLSRGTKGGEEVEAADGGDYDPSSSDQLLRRRSAHALRLMVEYEREQLLRDNGPSRGGKKKKKKQQRQQQMNNGDDKESLRRRDVDLWTKYALCFEMLEMETEPHLVEQVWPTLEEIASEVAVAGNNKEDDPDEKEGAADHLPRMKWDDVGSLLSRILLSDSPTMRKIGLYHFLSGKAGVDVGAPNTNASVPDGAAATSEEKAQDSGKSKKRAGGASPTLVIGQPAPLSAVSCRFVLDVVMGSYDSIVGTKVGSNMQVEEEGGKKVSVSIADLLSGFLSNYTIALAQEVGGNAARLSEFVNMVFGPKLIQSHKSRSSVLYYRSVAAALDSYENSNTFQIEPENVQDTIRSMRAIFSSGGAPKSMQDRLKLDLALVLKNSQPWEKVDAVLVLRTLALYPPPDESEMMMDSETDEEGLVSSARASLRTWLRGLGDGRWSQSAPSACASAFVMGHLMPFGGDGDDEVMDMTSGVNAAERETGMAICALCSLSGDGGGALWPAVFKGIGNGVIIPPPIMTISSSPAPGFCRANRSVILLEFGCREGVLSGMGNGDLLLDKSKEYMIPPPPRIELLLENAVNFILSQLMSMSNTLFEKKSGGSGSSSGSTRSSTSGNASSFIAILIRQLRVLHLAYPSSVSLRQAVDHMLQSCVDSLVQVDNRAKENSDSSSSVQMVKNLTLSYAALSCGATFSGVEKKERLNRLLSTCLAMLGLDFSAPLGMKKEAKQASRSIFQYAKWGSLSLIVPMIMEEAGRDGGAEAEAVYQEIIASASNSVDATPLIALQPLFECVLCAGKHMVELGGQQQTPLLSSLQSIIETLFAVLEEETSSANWTYMLNEMCRLVFRGELLLEEYQSSYSSGSRVGPMPIMQTFEKLLRIAGTSKPHICKTAVSQISVAWLGPDGQTESDAGVCAIPYRDHIVALLIYKECRFDENSTHEGAKGERWKALPDAIDGSSITRAFVLLFLSKLPSPRDMSEVVLKELIHPIMMKLIDVCCTNPARGKAFISGSEEYARMTRSWQALCLLSRFVTEDIVTDVAAKVFHAMAYTLHGQIRFFIEVFTIQITRSHPNILGQMYIQEIRRSDLSLQHVSSLMIIGGNLTAGRYSNDFFCSPTDPRIKDVLCGVLPWLSSTQGFSRAIAQLLCHKLIPLVIDIKASVASASEEKDDAVLRSIYSFLEANSDMSRLRKRQQSFFDTYDVDSACTFEGLLSIPVDEGEEASPMHMVDAIKDCLADVYKEARSEDAPSWKQMEDLLLEADPANHSQCFQDDSDRVKNEAELVNFQRKILPIDSLELGIRSFYEKKSFNAAGKKKQSLIVCASLIDKVPNLAGLARSCEIFAAECLVLPNLLVRKQDDFKTISASANDWIEMEECKEEGLLNWLYEKKSDGYVIVGVEQTSSSKCLTKTEFPDKTVLLLGKEKEGIPIEILSAVDQCIEIPQLGIIRSLNVHVSGAISIWEYTKQMLQNEKY